MLYPNSKVIVALLDLLLRFGVLLQRTIEQIDPAALVFFQDLENHQMLEQRRLEDNTRVYF